jgi:hypothetical protein
MTTNQASPPTLEPNELLLECAEELRRLANALLREVRQGHSLPSLSSLVAMKPLQNVLFERLASRFEEINDKDDDSPDECLSEKATSDEKSLHSGYL